MDSDSIAGYAGDHRDPPTGGYLLGNGYRLYLPALMRFSSGDSVSPFDGGGINRYAYCTADPINKVDPSGHLSFALGFAAAFGGVALAFGLASQIPSLVRMFRTAAETSTADVDVVTQEMGMVTRSVDGAVDPPLTIGSPTQSYAHPVAQSLAPSVAPPAVAARDLRAPRVPRAPMHFDVPTDSIEAVIGRELSEASGFLAKSRENLEEARRVFGEIRNGALPIKERNVRLQEGFWPKLRDAGESLDDAGVRIDSVSKRLQRFNPVLDRRLLSITPEYRSLNEEYDQIHRDLRDWASQL